MEKCVEYYQQDVRELYDVDILSEVLTVSDMVNDTVVSSYDVVYKSDFDKLLRLYNSLVSGIQGGNLCHDFHDNVDNIK
jgi:hypothetical protein